MKAIFDDIYLFNFVHSLKIWLPDFIFLSYFIVIKKETFSVYKLIHIQVLLWSLSANLEWMKLRVSKSKKQETKDQK